MLYSQIKNSGVEPDILCIGVEVDIPYAGLVTDVQSIGFLANLEEELNPNLLGVILQHKLANRNILLEVPFESALNRKDLLLMGISMHCDFSFLPPVDATEENLREYNLRLCEITREWLCMPCAEFMVFPVAPFFQYMVNRELGYSLGRESDQYIELRFASKLTTDQSDAMKIDWENTIHDVIGGKEDFTRYVNTVAKVAADKLVKIAGKNKAA